MHSSLRPENRAAIDLARLAKRYLAEIAGGEYIGVRRELRGRDARLEHDLHFVPERIETVSLDGIEHADEHEWMRPGHALIAHVDCVNRPVVREGRCFAA